MRHRIVAMLLALACFCPAVQASRTVTDEAGRRVTLADHPHRLICLAPSVTDTVFALGAGDDVVAVSDFTTSPPAALKKPSIGSLIKPSIETIVSLHPDLVVGTEIPGSAEIATQLGTLGIPVYLVDPHGIAGILRSVTSLGEALNRMPQATRLRSSLAQRIEAVKSRSMGKPTPRILIPIWYDPIITVGKHAFISELIEIAGGKSVTDDLVPDWPQVSMELVLARAPEALLLIRGGKIDIETLRSRPGWSTLGAVRTGKVFYVDTGIQDPSPVAIDALEEMAKEFHP
jgi:iron complex transport system substrate-binding protein